MTIYQDIILEHYRHPKNKGNLKNPSQSVHVRNPVCGDDLHLDIQEKNGIIIDIAFHGTGCAISQAAASLLFEFAKGKTKEEIRTMNKNTVLQLIGIELSPVRLKCALLALEALKKAVK